MTDSNLYYVVRNDEAQHALWPATLATPDGWEIVAPPAPRAACLDYIEANWTDMRPLSLRTAMQQG